MPDIASAMPLQPTAPQALAGVAPIASAAPGPIGTDAGMPNADFLGQLKAALKSLAGVVTAVPAPAAPGQLAVAAASISLAAEQPAPVVKTDDQKPMEADLAQVVAALGLVVTPTAVNLEPTSTIQETTSAPAKDATPGPLTLVVTPRVPQQAALSADAALTATHDPATPAATMEPAKADTTRSVDVSGLTPTTPTTPAQTTHVTEEPIAAASAQVNVAANPAPPASVQTHQPTAASVTAPVTTTVAAQPLETQFQSGSGSSHHDGSGTAAHEDSATLDTSLSPAPDHTFAAVADSAVSASTNVAAQEAVHPGEVVSQIAHQAELYKLPGNKGVRIQLHPEDLGGVQVTVRYAAGGGLELHIAVEHATTGALVQAGWSELRDALATQGFSPDRLVMNVSAAGSSNQLDFSSNGGHGYRPDANAAAFANGGQSGQKRGGSDPDGLFSASGWTSDDDVTPVSEAALHTAGVSAPSRIDYRV